MAMKSEKLFSTGFVYSPEINRTLVTAVSDFTVWISDGTDCNVINLSADLWRFWFSYQKYIIIIFNGVIEPLEEARHFSP